MPSLRKNAKLWQFWDHRIVRWCCIGFAGWARWRNWHWHSWSSSTTTRLCPTILGSQTVHPLYFFLWKAFVPLCNGCLECKTRRLSFLKSAPVQCIIIITISFLHQTLSITKLLVLKTFKSKDIICQKFAPLFALPEVRVGRYLKASV